MIDREKLDRKVIVFTGAGVSKESGIPTFDELPGIREKLTRSFEISHRAEYRQTIKEFKEMLADKEPNAAHYAIADLGCTVLTMNIDGLQQKAGSQNVIEMHGSFQEGLILYGDQAPKYKEALRKVAQLEYNSSVLLIVGTSFYTQISNDIVQKARQRRAGIVLINENATLEVPKAIAKIKDQLNIFYKL